MDNDKLDCFLKSKGYSLETDISDLKIKDVILLYLEYELTKK